MNAPKAAPELVRWDVPFADKLYPSVSIITKNNGDTVLLAVAPHGMGEYPKYLVRFEHIVTLLYYEETCAIERGYESLLRDVYDQCAYRWITSPWLKHYRVLEDIIFNGAGKLHHYLLFGSDSIVEVIALGEGTVERIDSKILVEIKHEV